MTHGMAVGLLPDERSEPMRSRESAYNLRVHKTKSLNNKIVFNQKVEQKTVVRPSSCRLNVK